MYLAATLAHARLRRLVSVPVAEHCDRAGKKTEQMKRRNLL